MPDRVLLVVRSEPVAERFAREYHEWYADHMRKLLAVPGVDAARRFESVDGEMRYMAMYDIASREVIQSDAYQAVASIAAIRDKMRFTRNVYREVRFDGSPGHGDA